MLDNRTLTTVMLLCRFETLSLYDLTVRTGFDRSLLEKQMLDINAVLTSRGFEPVKVSADAYRFPPALAGQYRQVLELFRLPQIYLSQSERLNMIYLSTFCRAGFVSNSHYQDLLQVSRNTALADVRHLRERCRQFHVGLTYSRAEGYRLAGSEDDKHRLAFSAISDLLNSSAGPWALDRVFSDQGAVNRHQELLHLLEEQCHSHGLKPIQDYLTQVLYLIQFLCLRFRRVREVIERPEDLASPVFGKIARRLIAAAEQQDAVPADFIDRQLPYLSLLLAGCFEGEDRSVSAFFDQLTEEIITAMVQVSLVSFDKHDALYDSLKKHLIPAYYRLSYGLINTNAYTETIKRDYRDLFFLVQKALAPLEAVIGYTVPDSEVSYFVLHFGGFLEEPVKKDKPYKALIVCPNGISSSLIIKEELKTIFDNLSFVGAVSLEEVQMLDAADHEICLLICIAAVDDDNHLKALTHLTKLLREEANIKALLAAKDYQTIQSIIKQED